jgi:hypothetical protein
MNEHARRSRPPATYRDVLDAPPHGVAELVEGALHLHPRPSLRHAFAGSSLGHELGGPFQKGSGGPGGWWVIDKPELHLGPDVLVPDLAGWRRERMPEFPDAPWSELPPDWVCEVLSPGTRGFDLTDKRRLYAANGVAHLWLQRLENWKERRALRRPYFLRSTVRESRVRKPPFLSTPRSSGS